MTADRRIPATSLFVFPHDVLDAGPDTVLDHAVGRAGVDGVSMAVAYHAARDIAPHGRAARIRTLEPGVAYFHPDRALYDGSPLVPPVSRLLDGGSPLESLLAAAERRGADVRAWVVALHHDRVGELTSFAPQNAFGDALETDLCVAHPDVRAYARALITDVARRGVTGIVAEALHHGSLEHGTSHERYLISLGPLGRFLLALCFCEACQERTAAEGVDARRLRRWVADALDGYLSGDVAEPTGPVSRASVAPLAGGDMAALLRARESTVVELAAELAAIASSYGVTLTFLDPSGARPGYGSGFSDERVRAAPSWALGLDLERLGRVVDEVGITAYGDSAAQVRDHVEVVRERLGPDAGLCVALRPLVGDVDPASTLASGVEAAVRVAARRVDFYHYGLLRLASLDHIRAALAHVRGVES